MPNLRHLWEDLENRNIDPDKLQIPGELYDDLVQQAEDAED